MKPSVFVLTNDLSNVLGSTKGLLLPPAVQATALAKYSRSPLSAKELVREITNEDAEAFQEKWGVTYGHSSVAELATVPYCFEGVSIIASKFLESYQRAGYSEKSTRYQKFDASCWIEPAGAPVRLRQAATILFDAYQTLEEPVQAYMARLMPNEPERVQKARAFDSLRYLLPAGTGTNLAAVLNARDARYMMSDLLGSHLPEFRALGEMMVSAARDLAPVFAMGAKPNSFEPTIHSLGPLPEGVPHDDAWVRPYGLWDMLAGQADSKFWWDVSTYYKMTDEQFDEYMQQRGKNQVPALFKTVPIGFDIMMDYGAFRDLQRHRRCEQYLEPLTPHYGYVVPDDLKGTEFEEPFRIPVEAALDTCDLLIDQGVSVDVAQYALPLATLFRSAFMMDLREFYYITELRTQPQGHISYRRIAWAMAELGRHYYPKLTKWCRAIEPTTIGAHT